MRVPLLAVLALTALPGVPEGAALAQARGEMTLYSAPNFGGTRYTVTGPRQNIALPWPVRSIRIIRGERWQVCARNGYQGGCATFDGSVSNLRRIVASARPLGVPTPLPQPVPPGGGGNPGPSLRGMSAEFFAAPRSGGRRVEGSRRGIPSEASAAADRFCRSRGWTASAHERMQTVGGVNYLADVLCTRTN